MEPILRRPKAEYVLRTLIKSGPLYLQEIAKLSELTMQEVREALHELRKSKEVVVVTVNGAIKWGVKGHKQPVMAHGKSKTI